MIVIAVTGDDAAVNLTRHSERRPAPRHIYTMTFNERAQITAMSA